MLWRVFLAFVPALLVIANFWVAATESIITRTREDGIEGALGVRVAGQLNQIVNLNLELKLLRSQCPSAIWWPPAVAALRAKATYVVIRQTMLKTMAELDLRRTHIEKGSKVSISPTYRDLPDPCSLPGELHWIRHTIYSHRIHRAGVEWELSQGRPLWRYANRDVRAP